MSANLQGQGQPQGSRFSFLRSNALTLLIFLLLIGIFTLQITQRENRSSSPGVRHRAQEERDYATSLQGQGLYKQAIEAYRNYLSLSDLDADKRAHIHYQIATLYREKLNDFEGAMAEYLRVKQLAPDNTLVPEINRRLVECLERLERPLDAQRTLKNSTALKNEDRQKSTAVNIVARIGDRLITLQDLHDEIQKLPPALQKKYDSPKEQLQFLQQYIARELLYETALRRGYDRDSGIQEDLDRVRRELMVQKLVSEEIKAKIQVSEAECRLYYEAHKDRYEGYVGKGNKPGAAGGSGSVQALLSQVEADLRKEKEQGAYQELLQKTLEAQQVEIFDYLFTQQGKDEK
ncbi:MAG: hypothetical protein AB1847_09855 [bacterium]